MHEPAVTILQPWRLQTDTEKTLTPVLLTALNSLIMKTSSLPPLCEAFLYSTAYALKPVFRLLQEY